MRKPLKQWETLKRTYRHGDKTYYTDRHLGVDIICPVGVSVFAPADGEIVLSDKLGQGGHTIHYRFKVGDKTYFMRLLHLSERMPLGRYKMGDKLGKTGNSGLSTAPHLHCDMSHNTLSLHDFDNFIDPEEFFMTPIKITTINFSQEILDDFKKEVARLSNKNLTLEITNLQIEIDNPTTGMLTQDQAYAIADANQAQFLFIGYPTNATSSFLASYYYPKLNSCITTCPLPTQGRLLTFELGHQLQTWYNANRGDNPYIPVVDVNFPADQLITDKLSSVFPYLDLFKKMELIRYGKDVYRIRNGKRDLFLNYHSFEALDGRWDKIETVDKQTFEQFKEGDVLIAVQSD